MDPTVFTPLLFWLTAATVLLNRLRPKRERMEDSTAHWLPLAVMAASAVANLLKNRSANNAQKDALKTANQNAANQDKAVKDFIASLESRGIDPYANVTTQSSEGTSSTSGSSRTTGTQQQRRVIDPSTLAMSRAADYQLEKLLAQPQKVSAGEQARQVATINRVSEGARRAVENVAAARGLSGAQAGALEMGDPRTRNILDYLATIPKEELARSAALRAEAQGVTNSRMGSDLFSDTTTRSNSTTNSSGSSRTEGPARLDMLNYLIPRDRVSEKTGYSLGGNLLGAAADAGAGYYAMTNGIPNSGGGKTGTPCKRYDSIGNCMEY
jgi:hypothetical protein